MLKKLATLALMGFVSMVHADYPDDLFIDPDIKKSMKELVNS